MTWGGSCLPSRASYARRPNVSARRAAEEALRLSEERLRTFVEAMPVGAVLTGLQGQILMSNRAALELLGLSEEQLAGKTALDVDWQVLAEDGTPLPPETLPPFTIARTGTPVRDLILGIARPALGDRVWVQGTALPYYAADGSFLGILSTFTDVTARRQAAEALRASEARFRSLFEHAPIGIALSDMQGHTLLANASIFSMLGYDADELRGMRFSEFAHPDDLAVQLPLLQELLAGTRDTYSLDSRRIRKDGRIVWGHVAVSVTRDMHGVPEGIIAMLLDLTERREAEERLRLSEAQYRRIVETAQEGIWLLDAEYRTTFVNQKMADMLGYASRRCRACRS